MTAPRRIHTSGGHSEARQAVLRHLAEAHDRWAEHEQFAAAMGEDYEAEGAHKYALIVLRAYRAELDNPPVKT